MDIQKTILIEKLNKELVPVSTFAIRDWTKDIRAELEAKTVKAEFIKIPVEDKPSRQFLFIFKHTSGFSIEVTDSSSLEYLLYKLKSMVETSRPERFHKLMIALSHDKPKFN